MWVVSLTLAIIYAYMIYQPLGSGELMNESSRLMTIPETLLTTLPILLIISTIVFMDASGTYKRHYIEYTIAAFGNGSERRHETQTQRQLDQF
jgi:hypothetical protein